MMKIWLSGLGLKDSKVEKLIEKCNITKNIWIKVCNGFSI